MEKFEYSHLNKFLVSIGITLVVTACIIPWLYLKEPFDLNIEESNIKKLTPSAQIIISRRQDVILYTIDYMPYVSITLFSLGLISTAFGIQRWNKIQNDIDKREVLITQKHEVELKNLTNEEIVEQNIKENKAAYVPTIVKRETFVTKYLQLERLFFEQLMQLHPKYQIISNNKIDEFEYDIIVKPHKGNHDYIFEVKYFPKEYSNSIVKESVIRLSIAAKHYINKTLRQAKPILLIVTDVDITYHKKELAEFTKMNLTEFREITLVNMDFKELQNLPKEEILRILSYSDNSKNGFE
jgi:hypothetical protein